jgi:nicotinamide riboside kinase
MALNDENINIYIIGPQSTGKTTLVNALEKSFINSDDVTQPTYIREVARTVLKTYNFTRDDITNSPIRALELQELILKAQRTAEEAAVGGDPSTSWFISDRSGLDPIVYAKLFVGEDAAQKMMLSEDWKALEDRMKHGLVILCEAGSSWLTDDGTRLMPKDMEDWLLVNSAFRSVLGTLAIESILIPKDVLDMQHRVQIVLDALWKRTRGQTCTSSTGT